MSLLIKNQTRNKVQFIYEDVFVSADKNQPEIGTNFLMKIFMFLLTK